MKDEICVCYLYCDYNNEETTTGTNLVANLLQQLLRSKPQVPEDVISLYRRHSKAGTRPSRKELTELLHNQFRSFSEIFLVVDALDEIPEKGGERESFMDDIRRFRDIHQNIRILITSRRLVDIETDFAGESFIEVRAIQTDIETYVEDGISKARRLRLLIRADHSIRQRIKERIVSNSRGM